MELVILNFVSVRCLTQIDFILNQRRNEDKMGDTAELKQAVARFSEALQKTTELFYTQKEAEGYQAFGSLLVPLSNLLDALFALRASSGKPEFDEKEIARLLTEAVKAVEEKDGVLLADILQYDFLDQLEQIGAQL